MKEILINILKVTYNLWMVVICGYSAIKSFKCLLDDDED